jgi:hypothetical protein
MDIHSVSWSAVIVIGGAGYFAGAVSMCLVLGLLRSLRWARAALQQQGEQ